MSYRLTVTDNEVRWNDAYVKPLVTLADKHGGRAQIVLDDHCYVLLLQQAGDDYKPSYKNLPSLE